ncbi:MAG: hypothetical protein AAGA48_02145 [Myxococcota bacterium]
MKLHEVVAIRKGVKSRTYGELTDLHRKSSKEDVYAGMSREYAPKDDDGETFPPEDKKVQLIAEDVLKKVRKLRAEFFDIEATQEHGNLEARGDVIVEGETILTDVPVTLLIFLEKELTDLRTFVDAMPTLDEAKTWHADPNSRLHRSDTAVTHKTKKVQRPIVLYDAVVKDDHAIPAQTQLITEDVIIGHWHTTHLSGALPTPRKEALLERLEALRNAVKRARSRANDLEVKRQEMGAKVFRWLFEG